ncbi:hypothetical protein LC76P1_00127 [Lysinibacillus phage LC76P1]|nr:hypothetical protein LC76P1_00127 [Lysinibacillus phage LC76P1]
MAKTIVYTSNKTLVQSGNTFTISSGMNIGTNNVTTSGKWYWEVKIDTLASAIYIGVTNSDFSYNIANADQSLYSLVLHCGNRNFKYKNTTITSDLTSLVSGDVIGIFVDADSKIVQFYKNGVKFKEIQTDFKDFFPFVGYGTTSGTGVTTFNFGVDNFFYVPKDIDYTALAYETEKRFIFLNKLLILSGNKIISIKKKDDNLIPSMTSNTTPSGIAFSNSINSTYLAWQAFDGKNDPSSMWSCAQNANMPLQLGYKFTEKTVVNRYTLHFNWLDRVNASPKDWTFEGSNNDTDYVILDSRKGISWTGNEKKEFKFHNTEPFLFYRMNITADNGRYQGYVIISEMQMFDDNTTLSEIPSHSEQNFINHGMDKSTELDLSAEITKKEIVNEDGTSHTIAIEPTPLRELLANNISIIEYTDNPSQETSSIILETEPFSVYDYISETPSALVYMESTEDITVSTATEPFDIYDEFGESVEVLYYTDDETVTNADLILEANWSLIDELEGDFEVVTWTDEEDAHKILEMTALPAPQFTYDSDGLIPLEEFISSVKATDLSIYDDSSMARFLMSNNNSDWYTWNGSSFVKIANMTNDEIILNGMTAEIFNGLTPQDLTKWIFKAVNIGVFLYDDIRERVQSKVSKLSIDTQIPSNTSKVEDVNLYILNTTAKINIDLSGLSLTGQVVDDDMTRVQYRVSLNGKPYFPADGNFTALSNPPLNIDITIKSDEVKVGDWNTIEVEFQDYFGTTDTWSAQFIGKYAGIMFSDPEGNYYSTDVGKVLKYLEFGEILTGQVTPYYEVKLKNEYGFDVRDATLAVNTQNFPKGLTVELSDSSRDIGDAELQVGDLANDEEFTFYVRMKSTADTVPNDNSKFDIVVLAIRDV